MKLKLRIQLIWILINKWFVVKDIAIIFVKWLIVHCEHAEQWWVEYLKLYFLNYSKLSTYKKVFNKIKILILLTRIMLDRAI